MKIDKKLNLVAQVDTSRGTVHIHSMPISRAVFEDHFLVLSRTFSRMYAEGLNHAVGPRMAHLLLRDVAEDMGIWNPKDGSPSVQHTLVNEIKRLTNVVLPAANGNGWESLPFDCQEIRNLLDEDDLSEIEGTLIFFTLVSSLHRKKDIAPMLKAAGELWNFQAASLTLMEYQTSLQTLTQAASTGETTAELPTAQALSIPH